MVSFFHGRAFMARAIVLLALGEGPETHDLHAVHTKPIGGVGKIEKWRCIQSTCLETRNKNHAGT